MFQSFCVVLCYCCVLVRCLRANLLFESLIWSITCQKTSDPSRNSISSQSMLGIKFTCCNEEDAVETEEQKTEIHLWGQRPHEAAHNVYVRDHTVRAHGSWEVTPHVQCIIVRPAGQGRATEQDRRGHLWANRPWTLTWLATCFIKVSDSHEGQSVGKTAAGRWKHGALLFHGPSWSHFHCMLVWNHLGKGKPRFLQRPSHFLSL